jgi:hypothetical protein
MGQHEVDLIRPDNQMQRDNFAFWLGLMLGRPKEFDKIENAMDFKKARNNFIKIVRTTTRDAIHFDHIESN